MYLHFVSCKACCKNHETLAVDRTVNLFVFAGEILFARLGILERTRANSQNGKILAQVLPRRKWVVT